jgi:hypothetical protein
MNRNALLLGLLVFPALAFISTDHETANKAVRTACEAKLLPYSGWKETPQTKWSLDLKTRNAGTLVYIGAEQSVKPDHPQFARIRNTWQQSRPTIVFYEGPNRGIAATETETIRQFGEAGFVRFLANEKKLKTQSLEPNPQEEMQYLLGTKKYTPEQVKLFFVLRETARLRDQKGLTGKPLKLAVSQFIQKANGMFPAFKSIITDTIGLQTAYARYWTSPFSWTEVPSAWFDPKRTAEKNGGKFTSDINRISSQFRDIHMYNVLSDAVQRGEKVFAVVGRNHVPMQAEALKCSLKGF